MQCARASSYIHPDTLEHLTDLAVSYIPTQPWQMAQLPSLSSSWPGQARSVGCMVKAWVGYLPVGHFSFMCDEEGSVRWCICWHSFPPSGQ